MDAVFLMASHAAFVPAAWYSLTHFQTMVLEFVATISSFIASMTYHGCLISLQCVVDTTILRGTDICCVYLCFLTMTLHAVNARPFWLKFAVFVIMGSCFAVLIHFRPSGQHIDASVFCLVSCVVVSILFANVFGTGLKNSPRKHWRIAVGLSMAAVGLGCYLIEDMTIEASFDWIFHSFWHIFAMVGYYFLLSEHEAFPEINTSKLLLPPQPHVTESGLLQSRSQVRPYRNTGAIRSLLQLR